MALKRPESACNGLEGVEAGIQTRAEAAHRLIAAGEIDPLLALSYVVWPSQRLAEQRRRPGELRERALELVDTGLSHAQTGRELGLPRTTVTAWVRRRRVAA